MEIEMNDRQNGLSPVTENLKRRSVQHGALRSGNARQSSTRNAVEWWRLFTLAIPPWTAHQQCVRSRTARAIAENELFDVLPATGFPGIVDVHRSGVGL